MKLTVKIGAISFLFVTSSSLGMCEMEQKCLELVEQVEKGEAEPSVLDRLPGERWGTLRILIQREGRVPLVRRLLQAGADPNFYDGCDIPLSGVGTKEAVELLLGYGADPQKSRSSLLSTPMSRYVCEEYKYREGRIGEKPCLKDPLDAMALLLQKGESINKYGLYHFLFWVVDLGIASEKTKKAFLSFLIRHGSNPNDPWAPDYKISVYDMLERRPECPWVPFIRKERGWALVGPLLLAMRKEQPDDCYMSYLPQELVRVIGEMVLGGSADQISD